MSADPDTGEIGKLRVGWPDPDGLTDEERWGRLPPELQAELEEMTRRLHEQGARASKGTYFRGGHALVFLLGMVADAEAGAIGRTEAAVRGAMADLADSGDDLAAAALERDGGSTRDRLARALLPLVAELWAALERRTGEALEAQGVPWAPVVGRILDGARNRWNADDGGEIGEADTEPPDGRSYKQAAEDDREDRAVLVALGKLRVPDPERPDAPELLAWDAWLADWLHAGGAPALAGEVLEAARQRAAEVAEETAPPGDLWSLWSPGWDDPTPYGSLPVLATLAEVAWPRLRAELERERRPVALPVGVLEVVMDPLRATGGLQAGSDGREWLTRARVNAPAELLAPWQPPTVAAQDAGRLLKLAREGVAGLVTVNAPRLVYWLAREVQLRGVDDARPLVFNGGDGGNAWAALADAVGAPADREGAKAMRGIVAALAATLLSLDTNKGRQEGNLLAYHYQEGRGRGCLSRLELRPGWPFKLNPAELRGEGGELSALAPLPPLLGNLPPMPGARKNDYAAGARLWLAVLAELARQNREIAKGNGAPLTGARLAGLAVEVGVKRPEPLVLGAGLLELWTCDSDSGHALLERVGPDRYHLGAAFPEERRLLEEGGQRREGNAERGEIATRKRSANAGKAAARRAKRKGDA